MSAAPECPFCGAAEVERVGQWGGQIITSQWRCGACGSYFEALREDFDDAPASGAPAGTAGGVPARPAGRGREHGRRQPVGRGEGH